MEILQPSWRGRSITSRKDSGGKKYTAMVGPTSLLYIPVDVLPNAVYKITLELCRESGNGVVYCNIYGNRNFDFKHSKVLCENGNWTTFDVDVITKDFPKTVPMVFRIWRGKEGTGTILVRKIMVEIQKGETEEVTTNGKIVAISEPGPKTPNPIQVPATKVVKKKRTQQPNRRKRNLKKPSPGEYFKKFNSNSGNTKVLYLPLSNRIQKQEGMQEAFLDNGFNLAVFDFRNHNDRYKSLETNKAFLNAVSDFKPDWIHMQLQFSSILTLNSLKQVREMLPNVVITNWTGDVRDESNINFIEESKIVDLSLISSVGQLELYRKNGGQNIEYWQVGTDHNRFYPHTKMQKQKLREKYSQDIVFGASKTTRFPSSNVRAKLVDKLSKTFSNNKFALYGLGWRGACYRGTVDIFETNNLYNAAKIVISINNFNDIEMYFSARQLMTMSSGSLVISKYIPGLERYFENGKDLVWFNDIDECVDLCKYYINHPLEAANIGAKGAKKVIEEHSYFRRVRELAIRIGMLPMSQVMEPRKLTIKKYPLKMMALSNETDGEWRNNKKLGEIEFKGTLPNEFDREVAEYQPDLFYVRSFNEEMIVDLKDLKSRIPDTVFCCLLSEKNIFELDKLVGIFDFMLAKNKMPENNKVIYIADEKKYEEIANVIMNCNFSSETTKALSTPEGKQKKKIFKGSVETDNIDISIVMGTYNRLEMLKKVINAIINETSDVKYEIIINDAGSDDGTCEWLSNMSNDNKNIVPIFSGKRAGITRSYNECFKVAKGKFVTWFSDDTVVLDNSIKNMCDFMNNLKYEDMAAFMFRNMRTSAGSTKYTVAKIGEFLSPQVGCMYTKRLEELGYWNMDYPHYGQDNEIAARVLRSGGNILECKNAFIDHYNLHDQLKENNVQKYSKEGRGEKLHIIYKKRYGMRSNFIYPIILIIDDGADICRITDTIYNIKNHYSNIFFHIEASEIGKKIKKELPFVGAVKHVSKEKWKEYDLIVEISASNKKLLNFDGTQIISDFAKELLK